MVQKEADAEPKRRGRPRAYDPEAALERVLETFWKKGYSGTSLDDLAAAAGMNRPSLYAAFGDKRALYLKALDHYGRQSAIGLRTAFVADRPLRDGLMAVYDTALSIYLPARGQARGCFAVGTATTEAAADPDIRAALAKGVRALDRAFETRIRAAREKGELSRDADPAALAILASATLHTIAIRARSGTPRAELEDLARKAVGVICGRQIDPA
ncbi:MAG: TetR/AcrR family transcriptional regulator [Beijerinckiaceae bacterium]